MAFTDSIKWNGKSIRDLFTEITQVKGHGKPPVEVRSVAIPGRHGRIAFKQTYKPRIIEIEGTIEGVSHATLMSNIESLKSLFAMEDETLSPGEESITDRFKYGRLEFGDESDRHYNAVFDSVFELQDISHQWMRNEMKLIRARFRCDEPFAISNTISEATMAGNADEFKVFSTGNVQSKPFIELSGAVTNPMLIEGDKVGVAHFDYNDNLSDVTLSTISGNFSASFGYRNRKSLTSQQSKAIQLTSKDLLYYGLSSQINGGNWSNINANQGSIILWIKPSFDPEDNKRHILIYFGDTSTETQISLLKDSGNELIFNVKLGGASNRRATINNVSASNLPKGEWAMIGMRWDINNTIDASANYVQLDILGDSEAGNTNAFTAVGISGFNLMIGKGVNPSSPTEEGDVGLIHWQLEERAITDSELTALYNSGAGVEPFVTPDTKLLSVGELSGGDPVSVQYPWVDNKFIDGDQENNPTAEWSPSTGSVTIANESTIVKYDTQSAKITWTSAPFAADAELATVSLVNDQDYFYRFWIYFETLDASDTFRFSVIGAGVIFSRDINSGTDDLGVTITMGKWLYFEGTFEADGTESHDFRMQKIETSGDATVYVDQMDCQVSLVRNGHFDSDTDWDKSTVGSSTLTISGGTTNFTYVSGTVRLSQIISAVNDNTWYLINYEITAVSGNPNLLLEDGNITIASVILDDSIGKHRAIIKSASTGGNKKRLQFRTTGGTLSLDNVSLIELDTVTANASSKAATEIDSYSQEKFGYGLRLDGGDTLSWNMTGNKNEGSVVCWLKPIFGATWSDQTDEPVIYELYYDTNNYLRLSYDWTNDKFIFRKRAAGVDYDAEAGNQTFKDGELLSIIGTYGSNGVRIYVNAVLGGVVNSNAAPLTGNPGTFYLSDNTQTQFPDAIFDEIYLLSRELSATEALKYLHQSKQIKNNNAKLSLTKTLSNGDKLLIDSEKETIEFADFSAGSFTNAIASMDAGSFFPNMDRNESVLFNKVANSGIKLIYSKKWL